MSRINFPGFDTSMEYDPSRARKVMKNMVYRTAHNPKIEVNANADRSRIRFRGNKIVAHASKIMEEREVKLGGRNDTFFNNAEKISPSNPI